MARKKSAADTLRRAKEKGSERDTEIVNAKSNFKKLEPRTERNYERMMSLWQEYVQQNPDASPYDLVSLKAFVREIVYGIDGAEGIEEACEETVRKYWNNFTAAWRRGDPEKPRDIARSVTHFIKGPLAEEDMIFGVFINEYGTPEFAVQLTRNAKNTADRPEKRPQHPLYEGAVPMLLCFNPMLPFLARLLAHGGFRDYCTIEELLSIVPPEGEMLQLYWKEELLDTPFFQSQPSNGSAEKIETAAAFSKRNRALGFRAGYPKPPTVHDWRAEGLYWIDKFYSEATRMVHAGHKDPNTLSRHYMRTNGADGQDTYLGGKGRTLVADLFRGLTVPRNPNLWQCLPAEKQYELENKEEYLALKEEIMILEGKKDRESISHRQNLYHEKRKLFTKELHDWQKRQPNKANDPPGYHRAIFNRASFMMPERYSLKSDLFQVDTLRSLTGLNALRAVIAIHEKPFEVEYRPGLEPDKCCCPKEDDSKSRLNNPTASYDWKHIYTCYKRDYSTVYGSAELCFGCNEWFFGSEAWEDHSQDHLNNLETFPIYFDPLIHGGVLATAGYCPFCVTDERLPASKRLYQFLNRSKWLEHIHKHVHDLDDRKPLKCPHPQPYCAKLFESVKQLQFHLQDAHGVDFTKEPTRLKRSREETEERQPVILSTPILIEV